MFCLSFRRLLADRFLVLLDLFRLADCPFTPQCDNEDKKGPGMIENLLYSSSSPWAMPIAPDPTQVFPLLQRSEQQPDLSLFNRVGKILVNMANLGALKALIHLVICKDRPCSTT